MLTYSGEQVWTLLTYNGEQVWTLLTYSGKQVWTLLTYSGEQVWTLLTHSVGLTSSCTQENKSSATQRLTYIDQYCSCIVIK